MSAAAKIKATTAAEVFVFMKKHGLTLEDLIEIGGEDLKSPNPKKVEKAKRVEKCWALMARLSVSYANLEAVTGNDTAQRVSGRRGEGHFSEVIENKDVLAARTEDVDG